MPELPFPDPPPADEAVRLRRWSLDDVGPAHRATQDPLIPRFTRVPADQTEDDVRLFLATLEPARTAGRSLGLVIADAGTAELLGSVGLLALRLGRAPVRDRLLARRRGRVVAVPPRTPSGSSRRWALRELALARVALAHRARERAVAARRRASEFVREGVLRSYEERDGRRLDVVVFSLLPADLE